MYMRTGGGLGDYKHPGDWTWEFYPPPYDFLGPSNPAAMPAPTLGAAGVGACHCGGACGGHGCAGLGVFDSGLDLTQWSWPEYLIAGGALYLGLSLVSDVMRVGGKAKRAVRTRRARSQRKARLREELAAL